MTETGVIHPAWAVNGGYFFNGNSYVAIIPDDNDRVYFVPDTLVELTKADLLARVIVIQNSETVSDKFVDMNDFHRLSDAELSTYVDAWWTENIGV